MREDDSTPSVTLVSKEFSELTTDELYGILQLRSRVFVVEQECLFLDLDGVDTRPGVLHCFYPAPPRVSLDSHGDEAGRSLEPYAYARLFPVGLSDGPASRPGSRSIGRVVTNPAIRGGGWGKRIIADIVAEHSEELLTLNAQTHLEGFYGSFGFAPNGPHFVEDGIDHTPMERPAEAGTTKLTPSEHAEAGTG